MTLFSRFHPRSLRHLYTEICIRVSSTYPQAITELYQRVTYIHQTLETYLLDHPMQRGSVRVYHVGNSQCSVTSLSCIHRLGLFTTTAGDPPPRVSRSLSA